MEDRLGEWKKPNTIFALLFYATYLIMSANGKIIPPSLENIVLMMVSFYYGVKAGQSILKPGGEK